MRVAQEKVIFTFSKFSKEPMVDKICSFKVVEHMTDEKVEGSNVLVIPVNIEELDDEKKKKNIVVKIEKEIVYMKQVFVVLGSIDNPMYRKKRAGKRGKAKKKKMASPWLAET